MEKQDKINNMNQFKKMLDKKTQIQLEKSIEKLKAENIPHAIDGTVIMVKQSDMPKLYRIQKEVLDEMLGMNISMDAIKQMFN